ncbi:dihydrolipoyllysine-residue acetyltransferase [Halomonas eurihalina]|uniref:Dihydrolipoamide acetyltransferase component of pyruvate dehydrogenase complex n=1 Tax=Halomonas eurihalina TaxID=42566 RepID=A0A5D9CKG2_HALER|nr:dihydrolipoyllysine-residue acetyltransferase [Halomonas eurihalina]MDR5858450.1 dihydrolipoyllysine-residue acetyltransferase [Halomonas eurihalina]TZG31672.1 dihydrolipoyllysine-residue acetyltransferase [Halomonas eurihalina]
MTEFKLPDIGEGIVECEVVEWRVQEGDEIAEDQPVVEVMTDKALVEITAPASGRVTRLHVAKGETARVHEPLFAYQPEGEADSEESDHGVAEAPVSREEPASEPPSEGPAREFILPDIGEGIVECEIVEWRIKEGDTIAEDQPVVDVMTDKAMVEITAPASGRVSRLHVAKGETARVHAPLFAYIPDVDDTESSREPEQESRSSQAKHSAESPRAEAPSPSERRSEGGHGQGQGAYGRIPASPAVRRLLRENDLRLEQVPGSGKDGRVLKGDVLAYLEAGGAVGGETAATSAGASLSTVGTQTAEARIEPLRGVRAAMAKRMVESASAIPHFQYGEEIDVTELLALRERLKPRAEASEMRLTLMPFFMKALALAVEAFPILNSRLDAEAEAEEIHYLPHCNIGMAVDGKAGLMVPNVKNVGQLSLLEIAGEVQRLTADARDGRVSQADLRDGTISISNIGALGGTYAAPIINAPEVAIVAIGKTQWLPRFDDQGEVVSRAIMTATWAGDHRLIDGGTIARFCNVWKGFLEEPETMLLELR